jgi:glycosyltransferase involved in cell wall biosynthesis
MRVLWLSHRDIGHPRAGGAERTAIEVGRRLVRSGHQVSMLTAGWRSALTTCVVEGVQIRRVPGNVLLHAAVPAYLRSTPPPDVVVGDLAHVVPWFAPACSGIPGTVVFRHLHARTLEGQVSAPTAFLLRGLERMYPLIYQTWPFVTESVTAVQDLSTLGIAAKRCVRIPPGVDLDLFRPGTTDATPSLVYFGGLRRYKRAGDAIRLLSRLASAGLAARLYLVGDGPAILGLRDLSRQLGVEDRVAFLGRLTQLQLAQLIRRAWLNLHFSLAEGWCLSAMEAAASGVPTVGYDVPGLRDSVAQGVSGLLVPNGDLAAAVDAARLILDSPHLWSKSSRGHAERFSWEWSFQQWQEHLDLVSRGSYTRHPPSRMRLDQTGNA